MTQLPTIAGLPFTGCSRAAYQTGCQCRACRDYLLAHIRALLGVAELGAAGPSESGKTLLTCPDAEGSL